MQLISHSPHLDREPGGSRSMPLPAIFRGPLLALASGVVLCGCESTGPRGDAVQEQWQASSGSCVLIAYRREKESQAKVCDVLVNGRKRSSLANASFTVIELPPGSHSIEFSFQKPEPMKTAPLHLTMERGKRYFVRTNNEVTSASSVGVYGEETILASAYAVSPTGIQRVSESAGKQQVAKLCWYDGRENKSGALNAPSARIPQETIRSK